MPRARLIRRKSKEPRGNQGKGGQLCVCWERRRSRSTEIRTRPQHRRAHQRLWVCGASTDGGQDVVWKQAGVGGLEEEDRSEQVNDQVQGLGAHLEKNGERVSGTGLDEEVSAEIGDWVSGIRGQGCAGATECVKAETRRKRGGGLSGGPLQAIPRDQKKPNQPSL